MDSKKGFTLMEMVVVVIIGAILAVYAVPAYQRFLERSRTAEAVSLMGSMVLAQERYHVKRDQYTPKWSFLDAAPEPVRHPNKNLNYSNDAQTIFYTRGGGEANPNNGYAVWFELGQRGNFVIAKRVGNEKYNYEIVRPFHERKFYCLPDVDNEDSINVCLDFAGVDSVDQLPQDPR